ncbi:MAG TPA: DNA translocase FtsK [Phycisphaerae bacterium]|nr:DNA translocase FtsK [Phycisphaerae bacterium]
MDRISLGRKVAAVVTFFAALFLITSILTFNPADPPSTSVWPPNDPVGNWCGPVGAHVAYRLFWALGDGVYPLLLFLVAAAFLWLSQKGVQDKVFRVTGALLLLVTVSVMSAMIQTEARLPESNGGVLGLSIWRVLEPGLGKFGTVLFLVPVGLVGLLLLTDTWCILLPVAIYKFFLWATGRARVPVKRLASAAFTAVRPAASASGGSRAAAEAADEEPAVRRTRRAKPEEPVADEEEREEADEDAPPPRQVIIRHSHRHAEEEEQEEFAFTPLASTPRNQDYQLPPTDLLEDAAHDGDTDQEAYVRQQAEVLTQTLREFGIEARVVAIETGPVITQYEVALAPGVKVGKVIGLSDDIAIGLKAPNVRIVAPLPDKDTIGIEVPNTSRRIVRFKEILLAARDATGRMGLPLFLGKDATGETLVKDLAVMPHLLIAGTTGSGKSVCLNAIIMSLLFTRTPDDLKFVLIDPKMVELSVFSRLPHLLCPVVNDMRKAEAILAWLIEKMEERYRLLSGAHVRNIAQYNRLARDEIIERFGATSDEQQARLIYHMPHIVVIVDELADLMMVAAKEVEMHVTRLSQKSRAVGIHLVMATQRPSVDVLTGLIKSNLPIRISFQVATRVDSRTILDSMGAEKLLGAGDMLFMTPGAHKFVRAQGAFVSEQEIQAILDFVTKEAEPAFQRELVQLKAEDQDPGDADADLLAHGSDDELYDQAVEIVLANERGSVSLLQRRLGIGYGRAARLIDQMAEDGLVGTYAGSQARECLLTLEEWEALKKRGGQHAATAAAADDADGDEEEIDT